MDTQQPKGPSEIAQPVAVPASTNNAAKNNSTGFIILFLIVLAILVTGASYFFIAQKKTANLPVDSVNPTPSVINAEQAQWQKYTDDKHAYSFYYPNTWSVTSSGNTQGDFELKYKDSKTPATIQGHVLTKDEVSKMDTLPCKQSDNVYCNTYLLTKTTNAFVNVTIVNDQVTAIDGSVIRKNSDVISLKVSQINFDTYQTVAIMLDTMRFKNEARLYKLQVCPDSGSADQATITSHGVIFPIEDIDTEYIKNSCK